VRQSHEVKWNSHLPQHIINWLETKCLSGLVILALVVLASPPSAHSAWASAPGTPSTQTSRTTRPAAHLASTSQRQAAYTSFQRAPAALLAPKPTVQFSAATYSVNENTGYATYTVTLSFAASADVNFSTSNGTAVAGSDYTTTTTSLVFANGATTLTGTVPIINDALFEGNETINLALSSPHGATLGTPSTAVLTILDDDIAPQVQFSSSAYSLTESGGSVTITATLSAASGTTATVNYATSNGSAIAGSDYTTKTGTLTFKVDPRVKTEKRGWLRCDLPFSGV
jgi:hypothetical protein